MEKRFWALAFLAVVLIAGVGASAFAPVEQQIDENNHIEIRSQLEGPWVIVNREYIFSCFGVC